MRTRMITLAAALLASMTLAPAQASGTSQSQPPLPPLDPTQIDYTPIGYYGPADEAGTPVGESAQVPLSPTSGPPTLNDPNPSGKWVAYDTNVWEALTLPHRHPGDNCNAVPEEERHADCLEGDLDDDSSDPVTRTGYTGYDGPGGSSSVHGTCPPSPDLPTAGECFNNQLEYLDYYEHSMETSFADLGLVVKRYEFESPGAGRGGVPAGAPGASGGQAFNIAATIPGADHPEEQVIVGAHYDVTDTAPAPAWDSAEGHTEVMRMAYIMADYYRKTGTRPSATIKFMPWDSEESGSHGSQDYVDNAIPPDSTDKVRAYFNVDPCAGAYPAFEEGTNRQVAQVMQLANPANWEDRPDIKARLEAFNATAETIIDQVFERLDDSITRPGGIEAPIFVSDAEFAAGTDGTQAVSASDRAKISTAVGGLALFGSDYTNFEEVGIPIFNFFPDYFGPHADNNPSDGGGKGIQILHTNNDNLLRINRLTSSLADPLPVIDPVGTFASEGWAKGMEMCAQVESTYMLQPTMVGAQTANTDPVAFYEALPNEAIKDEPVTFDANGTYQYSNVGSRTKEPDSALTFDWDFGDGTTGSGKVVQHAYNEIGRYTTKLTVTGAGGKTDTMSIPVVVIGSDFPGPVLEPITPADAEDGNFPLTWDFTGDRAGFDRFGVEESRDYRSLLLDEAEDIEANWTVEPPANTEIQPWQHSDSGTEKFFGNAHRSGDRSFWTGFSPPFGPPPPAASPGTSILTLKNPISVPAQGDAELTYWSFFRNESDDAAQVQVALTTGSTPAEQLDWETVDSFQDATNTCVGTNPSVDAEFDHRRVDISGYKGKKILVRFVYISGPSNPALSQPCGWYIDDISVFHGTWTQIATAKDKQLVVADRPNGTLAYRIKAIYADGVSTRASNTEVAEVTKSKSLPNAELARCVKAAGNLVLGSAAKDKLIGTNGNDVICGFNGKDKINGKGGNDKIYGGGSNDKLRGAGGKDKLFGEKGKDVLSGGAGNDKLKGGPKPDRLRGGAGRDKCGHNSQDTINC